jgi:hypothetical protein
MTYGELKKLAAGLLIGDNAFPEADDMVLPLLRYAFHQVSIKTKSLHLLSTAKENDMLRIDEGDYVTRVPVLPSNDSDELDIDGELGFPISRYIASFVALSIEQEAKHVRIAEELIKYYNEKVEQILTSIKKDKKGNLYVD